MSAHSTPQAVTTVLAAAVTQFAGAEVHVLQHIQLVEWPHLCMTPAATQ